MGARRMSPAVQTACVMILIFGTVLVVAITHWVTRAPELHPDDPAGFSDAEREEIEAVRGHEERDQ